MESEIHLNIPLLVPGVESEQDLCVDRLIERIQSARGILQAHIEDDAGARVLCIHYDPNLVPLPSVQRLAEREGAAVADQFRHESLRLKGMDCADCAASIEHILRRRPGIIAVVVSYASEKIRLEYDSRQITHEQIIAAIEAMGYSIEEKKTETWLDEYGDLLMSLASGLFLAIGYFGPMLGWFDPRWSIIPYILAYAAGGYDATRHAIGAARHGKFDIEFLMVVAALGAAALQKWEEGGLLLFLFSIGHSLEHFAMERSRNAIAALGALTPKTARVRRDNREMEIPVDEIEREAVVIVRNGERIPVDGVIVAGTSAVDQSPITGESVPVERNPGDNVFAGSINGDGALEVKVTKLANDTTLARVMQMVEEAQTQKSPTQRLTDQFSTYFVPTVIAAAVLLMIVPPLTGWLNWSDAFLRAMTVLVGASPCALALATPAAILSGVARAAQNGILIKGGVHLENLGQLRAIAFDKTGTLTRGKPAVVDIAPMSEVNVAELLRWLAAVESRSTHPLARAILEKAHADGIDIPSADQVEAVAGRGVRAKVEGRSVSAGSIKLFENEPVPDEIRSAVEQFEAGGKTTMVVRLDDRFLGVVALADQIRPEARLALDKLRSEGIQSTVMLTGDNARTAAAVAKEVGVSEFKADLLPEEKLAAIDQLLDKHGVIAMIGDGVNDAPALKKATLGIAMGAGGTDVALETADVALMADDLSKLPFAVALGKQTRRIIRQNLFIAIGVIAALTIGSFGGGIDIGVAIIFHEGSTLVVVANALRLLGFKLPRPPLEGGL